MPILYLAKINLNSNIFDVYDEKLVLDDVFNLIHEKVNNNYEITIEKKEKYIDAFGNAKEYVKISKYMFQEIKKKEQNVITGKVVRSFKKPNEELDKTRNQMIKTFVEENVSIYFYYDVRREMVTFCERQSFGYNQFMSAFVGLLNKCVEKYEFEIFLQKDKDVLDEKLKNLVVINKVRATLVPPNSNKDDLDDLRKELPYMRDFQEANANKVTMEYISDNMKMEASVMKTIVDAVTRGYGDVSATGLNGSGRQQTVSSSQDAAFTANIQDDINESDFDEESHNLIVRFLAKLMKTKNVNHS